MRSSVEIEASMVQIYPEVSLFDISPPLTELSPMRLDIESPDAELIAAAFSQFMLTSKNPLYWFYGTNPLILSSSIQDVPMPITGSHVASPLPQIMPGSEINFKAVIDDAHSLVEYRSDLCVIQWFVSRNVGSGAGAFEREKDAYDILSQHESSKNSILRCYGWLDMDRADALKLHPKLSSVDGTSVKALLFEHIDGLIPLSVENVTTDIAEAALKALCGVHAAHVLHGDIRRRNMLLLPDGRVVWAGFGAAKSASHHPLRRQDFWNEAASAWTLLYSKMLPDKLIGNLNPDY
ncbi:unnamed protein product [Somion occarium]|uniref:Non-specific serine/threonine protein kinase n=1 Tax=Somion occarium TaxID=3059160 RepID=A0ABP1CTK7_9APHY